MHALPAGPDAVLLDFAADDDPAAAVSAAAAALADARTDGSLRHIDDLTPGATTLLVQGAAGRGVDMLGVHRVLRAATAAPEKTSDPTPVEVPVTYDGVDLGEVATMLDVALEDVARIHHRTLWRVEFMGFAPGFGYLVPYRDADGRRFGGSHPAGAHPFATIGRRTESRHRVPAGSVAIAAGYSAVYPRESPGGWYLLGHTGIELWTTHAAPPALLSPGTLVRFVDGASS